MSAIDRFREILMECPDEVSRRWAIATRNALKKGRAGIPAAPNDGADESDESIDERPVRADDVQFSVLLLTPEKSDIPRLLKDYPTTSVPFALRLSEFRAEHAVLLVHATVQDLVAIGEKLPCWGFSRFSRLYLLSPSPGPDISEAEALGVSEWGRKGMLKPLTIWPGEKDPVKLAETLVPEAEGERRHLFAKKLTAGWTAYVGAKNWATQTET